MIQTYRNLHCCQLLTSICFFISSKALQANFTPGPSQIYFTVKDHMLRAFRDGIPSLSHRSKEFERIFEDTTSGLRELLQIPDSFRILFTASATEVWERTIQNLVEESSLHLVN